MKIIKNDCVYVQKNDLIYLWKHEKNILSSVIMKVFGDGVVIVNDSNRYDFVKFDDPSEIIYFKNLDWIIDYDLVKDLNDVDFITLGENIALEMNYLVMKFNEMDEIECENHLDMVDDYEKLEFKLCSLRDILWFKHGDIKMKLPEGIEYPNGYGKKKGKCLRKILSKFRKH